MAIKQIYYCDYLTGGTNSTYLDYADGNSLSNKDKAFVTNSGILYVYELNATSGAAESSPNVISPDTNAGTKRWILIAIMANMTTMAAINGITLTGGTNTFNLTNGTASLDIAAGATLNVDANLTVTAATSLDEAVAMSSKATVVEADVVVTLVCGTSGTITLDVNSKTLQQVKVGKMITLTGFIYVMSVSSPVGTLTMTGLPVSAGGNAKYRSAALIVGSGFGASCTYLGGTHEYNSTVLIINTRFAAGVATSNAADVIADSVFHITHTYFAP